jgi:hypothetical protein
MLELARDMQMSASDPGQMSVSWAIGTKPIA